MKVVAFGASNIRQSINQKLAAYAASQVQGAEVSVLDLNDFEMPIYSEDREKVSGIPDEALRFYQTLGEADAIVVSFAEYNGSYTSAYKNLFDWTSRVNMKVFQSKPVLMLATSPGQGGAKSVLDAAQVSAPYFDAKVIGAHSLPNFYDHFDSETNTISHQGFVDSIRQSISVLEKAS